MDDAPTKLSVDNQFVTPGNVLTTDMSFMRGHGTFVADGRLIASVAGRVERVNKLISVKPVKSRFDGEVGDVVVGRIIECGSRKWKVDIQGRSHAILHLAAINLPGGIQRRKTAEDELEMDKFFVAGDLLSAEVQALYSDGSYALHTRGTKYRKLRNGQLITIPSALVKRSKSHFLNFGNTDVILGLNGYIWISKHSSLAQDSPDYLEELYSSKNDEITADERRKIAKIANVIKALAEQKVVIDEQTILYALEGASSYTAGQLLQKKIKLEVANFAKNAVEEAE